MATITNLITNPSVETAQTGWGGTFNCTIARDATHAYAGTYAIKVTATATGFANFAHTSPSATADGIISFWAYHEAGSDRTFYARHNSTNGTGVTVPSGVWTRVTRTASPTASNQLQMIPSIGNAVNGEAYWIDAALVHEGTDPVDYFDGDSDNAEWAGTAHASMSVLTISASARIFPVVKIGQSQRIGPLRVG